ncbi:hypothetical protein QC762_0117070 (mitochondrion) [Podospora pseudocomata]|uniref:Secreted protein n=1 Tax=Podospora pseudocomata TaxID=2093779 RepID=A0ABR0G1Z5_9PEZI|nr:hypothetical protein QC762_0117070 [Podospora pseudocomata]
MVRIWFIISFWFRFSFKIWLSYNSFMGGATSKLFRLPSRRSFTPPVQYFLGCCASAEGIELVNCWINYIWVHVSVRQQKYIALDIIIKGRISNININLLTKILKNLGR